MKKCFLLIAAIVAISCSKNELNLEELNQVESNLTLFVNSVNKVDPKSAVGDHSNQDDDNKINKLEVFVFNKEGDKDGLLDAYQLFTGDNLTNINIKATTGKKIIYVIANSPKENWYDINTLDNFITNVANLKTESLKNFIMTGSVTSILQPITSLSISISRLVAKIELQGIKTNFNGTPYNGCELTNVKVFLMNVNSNKYYYNGLMDNNTILNNKGFIIDDVNDCKMENMLYDEINIDINDDGYSTRHYFYAYENLVCLADNPDVTKLVIQADLNGTTYYYPVSINQENYGYNPDNGHFGIRRNTQYSISITISRPGSLDPNTPLEHGVLNSSLNILDWETSVSAPNEF